MANQSTPILEQQASRREVMKKAAYVTPAILTLAAMPAFAGTVPEGKKTSPRKTNRRATKIKIRLDVVDLVFRLLPA